MTGKQIGPLYFTDGEKKIMQTALGLLIHLKESPKFPIAGIEHSEIVGILEKIPVEEEQVK
jgi:hypothetical protein